MRGARQGVPGDEVGVFTKLLVYLGTRRRRLAGGERGSRDSQIALHLYCERVRAAKNATRDPFRLLERRHGLFVIVERGAKSKSSVTHHAATAMN